MGKARSVLRSAPIALGLLSWSACRGAAKEPTAPPPDGNMPAATVSIAPAAIASAPPVSSASNSALAGPARPSPDLAQLLQSKPWQSFRDLWRELDRFETSTKADPFSPPAAGKIPVARVQAMREQLGALVEPMKALAPDSKAIEVIVRVVGARFDVVSGARFRLMTSHMAPMQSQAAQVDAAAQLEKRIDALLLLRLQGKVDASGLSSALTSIREDMEFLVVLQLLGQRMHYPVDVRDNSVQKLQQAIAQSEQALADSGTALSEVQQFKREVEQALEALRSLRPALHAMVADLER